MNLYLLDTDHVSLFQRKHPIITQNINQVDSSLLATTIITAQETIEGRLAQIKRAKS